MELSNGTQINGEGTINVILGKNGSGKSTLLRTINKDFSGKEGCVRYTTPERGGQLKISGDVEVNRSDISGWVEQNRSQNQWGQFKQYCAALFRRSRN